MAEEIDTSEKQRDDLADVVMARYRRAKEYRDGYVVHQGRSFLHLIERAEHQFRREYTGTDAADMERAFGFCPSRYYGLTQQKVNATVAWNSDLVLNNLDSMFTVAPSPEPELDQASIDRVREQVRRELVNRMIENGVGDPNLLLTADGQVQSRVEQYLREQVRDLKRVEQARLVSIAGEGAQRAQTRMRDIMIKGNFRQAYMSYTLDRVLLGTGVCRFPDWQRRPMLKHSGKKAKLEWETVAWFRHVNVRNFYPVADAIDVQTNTGNTEVTYVTKAELINMSRQDDYYGDQIRDIIEHYEYRTRNWIDSADTNSRGDDWWGLDQTIPLMIHEGFFSGDELAEHGITGLDSLDYVSARVEVCGARTIRCQLLTMPGGADRTYFAAPFNKLGDGLLDNIGLAGMLWDSEQRLNRLMHLFEHNIDWASRPPLLSNPNVFENPNDASNIVPGGSYKVEDRFATSGSIPEPVRTISTVSAQYHLIMSQVGAIARQADEDCGIPAFAYGAQDFGRSSLGEFSQRMSNALRTIKQAALMEDINFIEPAFTGLFHHEMRTDADMAEGQDVGVVIRGMTGLLQEDQKVMRSQQVLPALLNLSNSPNGAALVPEQALQYAVRQMLEQAGFPVDALGMGNPIIDQALATAASQPSTGLTPGGPQVPQLDGRSGVPSANVASPSGSSQFSMPGGL